MELLHQSPTTAATNLEEGLVDGGRVLGKRDVPRRSRPGQQLQRPHHRLVGEGGHQLPGGDGGRGTGDGGRKEMW